MPAELLALAAVVLYSLSQIVAKHATNRQGSLLAGFLVSLSTGTVVLGAAAATTTSSWRLSGSAVALFALAGLVGAGVGRLLLMRAIKDAGASVASPVQASSRPVAATGAAVLVLGEQVSAGRLVALTLVVLGLWLCARGGSANLTAPAEAAPMTDPAATSAPDSGAGRGRQLLRLLSWPVAAGMALAGADLFRKAGLLQQPTPVVAAFVGVATACLAWLAVVLIRGRRTRLVWPSWRGWYGLHGLLTAAALILMLSALRVGDLSLVAPIVASEPVFVVLLGGVLLRSHEVLRAGTIAGAVIVFSGVAAIAFVDGA